MVYNLLGLVFEGMIMESDPNYLHVFRSRVEALEEVDLVILSLLFEGRTESVIAGVVHMSENGLQTRLKSIRRRLGLSHRSRWILLWFYVQYLLPTDMRGTPLDKEKSCYTQPGEKLAEWTAWAKARRDHVVNYGFVTARALEAAALLARLRYTDKSYEVLGKMMSPPVGTATYSRLIWEVSAQLGGGGRARVFVVAMLAPFS